MSLQGLYAGCCFSAVKEAKEIRKESLQIQNDVAEIKLRAERRIGEFSRNLPKTEGKVNQYTKDAVPHDGDEQSKTSILREAGISHPERYEVKLILDKAEG